MTDNDTSNSGGVVDPSIFNTDTQPGQMPDIPTFLQRPNDEGQHELVVGLVPAVTVADAALSVLDQLSEQDVAAVTPQDILDAAHELAQPEQAVGGTHVGNLAAPVFQQVHGASDGNHGTAEVEEPVGDLTHNPNSNQPADPAEMRRDFFKDVNKFGKASGEGASALGRLGLRALRAAADGVLSMAKPQGGGKDDATLVYEAYTAMDSRHAEHTAGGAKSNASKLRQIIGMGCMTTLSDPVAIGDRVVRIREEMEGADLKPKALFAALVDVARDQQASDTELTDDAIKAACTKTVADKTLEKEWAAIAKRVEGLVTGENAAKIKDQSPRAIQIQELVTEHVKAYTATAERAGLVEALMERGYTRAMAENVVDKK